MSLPANFSTIFQNKQRTYKMVLILSLLDELEDDIESYAQLNRVMDRFLSFYQDREKRELVVERPPKDVASWAGVTRGQLRDLIQTPIEALSSILSVNEKEKTIGFHQDTQKQLHTSMKQELRNYASKEIEAFYGQSNPAISLRMHLLQIMKNYIEAKQQPITGHSLGILLRQTIPQELQRLPFIDERYKVQGSIGQGNWAKIPWIAILDRRITETTQSGEYIVYLFSEDMRTVYLTIAQGVTVPKNEKGNREAYVYLREKAEEMRNLLPLEGLQKDENIHLTTDGLGRDYQVSTVAYVCYERENMPDDEQLISDLENLIENYKQYVDFQLRSRSSSQLIEDLKQEDTVNPSISDIIQYVSNFIRSKGFQYPPNLIENVYLSLKTKPFIILAGISGTGKTKLVKLFAEAFGATEKNGQFKLISVRPDWSDPTDLIGYKDLSGVFRAGILTEVLAEASQPRNRDKPYFICLDEMNLARVEHYFSDFLSIMETQRWENGEIITDIVVSKRNLSLDDDLERYGDLSIPDNVYMIGTVNMDETTHPFSKKVLDRANTIEFNYIDLNTFPIKPSDNEQRNQKNIVGNAVLRSDYLLLMDAYQKYPELIQRTTARLAKINDILEEIHSHVGFRIRDAVCFYMVYNDQYGLLSEDEAFDFQLLQKILPRIQGSSSAVKRVLIQLMLFTTDQKKSVNEYINDASELYEVWGRTKSVPSVMLPHSSQKLAFMLRRLEEDGFTSYWLS